MGFYTEAMSSQLLGETENRYYQGILQCCVCFPLLVQDTAVKLVKRQRCERAPALLGRRRGHPIHRVIWVLPPIQTEKTAVCHRITIGNLLSLFEPCLQVG